MSPRPAETNRSPLDQAPVVAYVVRSGFVESVHHGVVYAERADGTPVVSVGPVDAPFLPRSSNKPLQALGMLRVGLDLDGEPLALACASHSGLDYHLRGVRQILTAAGLDENALQNTPDLPYDAAQRKAWIAARRGPTSLAQNCSGKHAAMLACCVANGWDIATYLDPDHPLQQAIAKAIERECGERVVAVAIDGCGAPVMAVSPAGLARAFGAIAAAAPGTDLARIREAMRGHPEYVGGPGRDVTELMRGVDGLVAKDGAEAVYAVGLADGSGAVVKIADGSQRARTVVMAAALRLLGVAGVGAAGGVGTSAGDGTATSASRAVDAAIETLERAPVLGHGEPVGSVVAVLPTSVPPNPA